MLRVEELHWSTLKNIGRSPAHLLEALQHPKKPNAVMNLGIVTHDITLGGDGFVVFSGKRRQGKDWDAFEAANEGKIIVKSDEFARCEAAAVSALSHPIAGPLLIGKREQKWKANLFGRKCAGRVDVVGADFITEFKTTTNAEPSWFGRQCLRMGYHAQLSWYRDAVKPGVRCFIVGVEMLPPHAVTVFELTERCLLEGQKMNRAWVEKLNVCESSGFFPAYSQSAVPLDVAEDVQFEFDGEEAA